MPTPVSDENGTTHYATYDGNGDVGEYLKRDGKPTIVVLQNQPKQMIFRTMDAADIIKEIVRLPEGEKDKVIEFVTNLPNAKTIEAIREPTDELPRYTNMNEVRNAVKDLVNNA